MAILDGPINGNRIRREESSIPGVVSLVNNMDVSTETPAWHPGVSHNLESGRLDVGYGAEIQGTEYLYF